MSCVARSANKYDGLDLVIIRFKKVPKDNCKNRTPKKKSHPTYLPPKFGGKTPKLVTQGPSRTDSLTRTGSVSVANSDFKKGVGLIGKVHRSTDFKKK